MKERIHWIDVCKGIAIFLVVLGHTYRSNVVQNWLYSFHMPLFFIISGYLQGKAGDVDIKIFFKKRIWTLLNPFILFFILSFIYWIIVERRFREFDLGPSWFLLVLFVVEMIVHSFDIKKSKKSMLVTIGIGVLGLHFGTLWVTTKSVFAWFPRVAGALSFYMTGILFALKQEDCKLDINKSQTIVLAFIASLLSILFALINGRVDLYMLKVGNIVVYYIAALIGTVSMISLSKIIDHNHILEYLGRYSIVILCTHEQIKRMVIYIVALVLKGDAEVVRNNIPGGCIIALIVMMLEIPVIAVLKFASTKIKNTRYEKWLSFIK